LLHGLQAPAFKIASFELVDLPLIRYAARLGKPMILSTGMAGLGDIADGVAAAQDQGAPVMLLHCTSGYPTPPEDCDLRTIPHLSQAFQVPVGLSDHTMGVAVPVAAVALGAVVIEKHFTLARADGGVDSQFSLEPQELAELVAACKVAHAALGQVDYRVKGSESSLTQYRRSLYVVADLPKGAVITADHVRSIRPGLAWRRDICPMCWAVWRRGI
jgi:N-acetylneuraminate synthase